MEYVKVAVGEEGEDRFPCGVLLNEAVEKLSPKSVKKAVAARVDGEVVDLTTPLYESCEVSFVPFDEEEGARVYWHTSSHILAQAVKRLYPGVKLGIGPPIKNGFYYDFHFPEPISSEELENIEEEMKKIVEEDLPIDRLEMTREEALEFFRQHGEIYKEELIEEMPEGETISFYRQGEFMDLCTGPHLPSTGKVKAFKLTSLAGAYWRGSEKNPMLQRIYGVSFPSSKELKKHLQLMEEARKRDHRKIGKELNLFSMQEEAPGFPFFHPHGMVIWSEMEEFWRQEHRKAGYHEIKTPLLLNSDLWKRSGHWDHYRENMYFTEIDEQDFAVKPMNCPGAMLVYLSQMHSYRDLPLRIAELGQVHRHELSGTLHGLMRVRSFVQDDAHLFMLPHQVEEEASGVIDLIDRFYRVFGFSYEVELSTRPEKSMGTDELWERAITILKKVLEDKEIPYRISEGEGAFYGPKIDFHLKDCLGRTWQCGTVQLDFQMPEKFDLSYVGQDGESHRPVMIHRVVYGAMERFMALLIEHFAGAFPPWIAPQQAIVLPLTDRQHAQASEVVEHLRTQEGFRVEGDFRNEKLGYKIREARLKKIPYMLIIGEKEEETGQVALRQRGEGDLGPVDLDYFIKKLRREIEEKTII